MLLPLRLVSLTTDRAVVGHAPRDRITAELALAHIAAALRSILGRDVPVSLLQTKDAPRPAPGPASPAAGRPEQPSPRPATPRNDAPALTTANAPAVAPTAAPAPPVDVEAARSHPLVKRAAELLGARIVRITARAPIVPKAAEAPASPAITAPITPPAPTDTDPDTP